MEVNCLTMLTTLGMVGDQEIVIMTIQIKHISRVYYQSLPCQHLAIKLMFPQQPLMSWLLS